MSVHLRVGVRGDSMALAQTRAVARRLAACGGPAVRTVVIAGPGSEDQEVPWPPATAAAPGRVTAAALRAALLGGEVDAVVHAFKDLPVAPCAEVRLAAVTEREDPRDALVWPDGGALKDLPPDARVGTGSACRVAQILLKLDMAVRAVPVAGTMEALCRIEEGDLDAAVVAMAGLVRLGRAGLGSPIDPSLIVPVPAQGALAVECRGDDVWTAALLRVLDHPPTRAAVFAERGFLAGLQAGRAAPVGALARAVRPGTLRMEGIVAARDGSMALRQEISGLAARPGELGRALAASLLRGGAGALLDAVPPPPGAAGRPRATRGGRPG